MTERSGEFGGDRTGSESDPRHEVVDLQRWRREHSLTPHEAAPSITPSTSDDQLPYGRLPGSHVANATGRSASQHPARSHPAEVLPFHGQPHSKTHGPSSHGPGAHDGAGLGDRLLPQIHDDELRGLLLDRLRDDDGDDDVGSLPVFDATGGALSQALKQPQRLHDTHQHDSDLDDLDVIGDLFLDPRFAPRHLSPQVPAGPAQSDAPVSESIASFAAARLAAQRQRHWGLDWLIAHVEAELNDAHAIQAILADMREELDLLEGSVQQLRDAAVAEREAGPVNDTVAHDRAAADLAKDAMRLRLMAQFLRGADI